MEKISRFTFYFGFPLHECIVLYNIIASLKAIFCLFIFWSTPIVHNKLVPNIIHVRYVSVERNSYNADTSTVQSDVRLVVFVGVIIFSITLLNIRLVFYVFLAPKRADSSRREQRTSHYRYTHVRLCRHVYYLLHENNISYWIHVVVCCTHFVMDCSRHFRAIFIVRSRGCV